MRELAKILAFTAGTLILGCILAPPLYWGGHALAGFSDVFSDLARFPFHRFFNRAVLVAAVVLVWPLLRSLGQRRWSDLGLAPNPARWRHLALGFGLASGGLAVVAGLMVLVGRAHLRTRMALDALPGAMLSAAAVAVIEESFFRGALLGALRRTLRWQRALVLLSLVFAAVHFLKPQRGFRIAEVGWASGFELLPHLFWQYAEPTLVVGGFSTLLLVGLVLGYSVIRTRSLFLALGLHAGWVFALKAFGAVAKRAGPASYWFGRDLLTGVAPVILVAATGIFLAWLLRPAAASGAAPTPAKETVT